MSHQILLIDDDEDLGKFLSNALKPFHLTHALSGQEGRELLTNRNFEVLLLDVNLGDSNGYDLCSEFSNKYPELAIIMLTANNKGQEIVFALNSGADDFITKPFEFTELKARIDARLRRLKKNSGDTISSNGISLDLNLCHCQILSDNENQTVNLTPTEFRILVFLIKNSGTAFSDREIAKRIGQAHNSVIQPETIGSHMSRIRKKLQFYGKRVKTLYGKGYYYSTEH